MHTNTRFTLAPVIALGASVLIGPVARAQSMDEADGRDSHFRIGAGAAYVHRYEGASDNKVRALPLRNYRNGRFFADARGGIGDDRSPNKSLSFGPLLSYRFGRDEDDADRLRGLAISRAASMRLRLCAGICCRSSSRRPSGVASPAMARGRRFGSVRVTGRS